MLCFICKISIRHWRSIPFFPYFILSHIAITPANLLNLSNLSAPGGKHTELALIPRKILYWTLSIILSKHFMPKLYNWNSLYQSICFTVSICWNQFRCRSDTKASSRPMAEAGLSDTLRYLQMVRRERRITVLDARWNFPSLTVQSRCRGSPASTLSYSICKLISTTFLTTHVPKLLR